MMITSEITIPVYGMSCQKCVAKITAALQAVDGVDAVVVSLEGRKARVRVADGGPGREDFLAVVVATGYQVVAPIAANEVDTAELEAVDDSDKNGATSSSRFLLHGMTCNPLQELSTAVS